MAEWGMMRHRGLRSVHEKRQVLADMSSVEVELVSDSYTNMDRCWALLNDEIDKAYITRPVAIGADLAKSLSESQVCKTNCVSLISQMCVGCPSKSWTFVIKGDCLLGIL